MTVKTFIHHAAGIDWYCETQGAGPAVVLIPSGEGDCAAFAATGARLAERCSVLTFDTPGFSRTSTPEDPTDISMGRLADQVASLVRSLGIESATFYGCSSGGRAVLDLACTHSSLVRRGLVHEAALSTPSTAKADQMMSSVGAMEDAAVVATCQHIFGKVLNEDDEKWRGLGELYHRRLERNYITWARCYAARGTGTPIDPELLRGRPITWTIGGLTPPEFVAGNLEVAAAAGIQVTTLPCRHFPHVSVPDVLAEHIARYAG